MMEYQTLSGHARQPETVSGCFCPSIDMYDMTLHLYLSQFSQLGRTVLCQPYCLGKRTAYLRTNLINTDLVYKCKNGVESLGHGAAASAIRSFNAGLNGAFQCTPSESYPH